MGKNELKNQVTVETSGWTNCKLKLEIEYLF